MNSHLNKFSRPFLFCIFLFCSPKLFSLSISNIGYVQLINREYSTNKIDSEIGNIWNLAIKFSENAAAKRGLLLYSVSWNDCEQGGTGNSNYYLNKPYITSWISESFRTGDNRRAHCWIKAFLSLAPEDGDAWYYNGMYHRINNDGDKAGNAFRNALLKDTLSIQQGIIYYQLGQVNLGLLKNYSEAEKYFRMAVAHLETDQDFVLGDSYCQLAYVLYEQNLVSSQ